MASMRDYVDGQIAVLKERLRGIDRATEVLNETVNRVPTDMQQEVGHIRELMSEKFRSIGTQFAERDTRQERESRDNEVKVNAAFAAQKEIAEKESAASRMAIDKSEKSVQETIKAVTDTVRDLKDRDLSDLKARVGSIESAKQGGTERMTGLYAALAAAVAIITVVILIANGALGR
jgi:hypothetical protein